MFYYVRIIKYIIKVSKLEK